MEEQEDLAWEILNSMVEWALAEVLQEIMRDEQDHQIDLANATYQGRACPHPNLWRGHHQPLPPAGGEHGTHGQLRITWRSREAELAGPPPDHGLAR